MSQFSSGKVVIGKIINTAVGTAAAIAFKDINGVTHTFAAGERLIIYNALANNRATAKDLTILQDLDAGSDLDTGEEMVVISFAAAGSQSLFFPRGLPSQRINAAATNTFMAFASAVGAVDVIIEGEVIKD